MYIDLHAHTYPASDDSFVGVDELVEGAKEIGLDGLCLTEHDYFWDPEAIKKLSRRHDFLVLSGSEVNTDEGHVLVFGLDKYVFGMHKPSFLARMVNANGGVMVGAHPYRRRFPKGQGEVGESRDQAVERACHENLFSYCHGIEAVNGRGTLNQNGFSQALSGRLNLSNIGGSDSHRLNQLGTACTRFEHRITCLEDLVREIKAGRVEAIAGGPSAFISHVGAEGV